jgi:hypothetical protein
VQFKTANHHKKSAKIGLCYVMLKSNADMWIKIFLVHDWLVWVERPQFSKAARRRELKNFVSFFIPWNSILTIIKQNSCLKDYLHVKSVTGFVVALFEILSLKNIGLLPKMMKIAF